MFCVLNANLNQLSVRFVVNGIEDTKQIAIEVTNASIALTIDGKHTLFTLDDSIELTPNSLRQLNAFRSTNNKQNVCLNQSLEMGFTLCAHFGSYCLLIQRHIQLIATSISLAMLPNKPSLAKTSLPINSELMNDWIFCCNHSHNAEESAQRKKFEEVCQRLPTLSVNRHKSSDKISDESDDRSLKTLSPVLTSLDQILRLMSERSDNKFLFESDDKKFSLYLNILNDEFIVSSISHQIESMADIELTLANKTSLFYKVFRSHKSLTDSQLNSYRFAFDVQYFMLESQLFETLLNSLVESTKTVLPLGLRYNIESALYFGYL